MKPPKTYKHAQMQYIIKLLNEYGYDAWMTYSSRFQLYIGYMLMINYLARLTNRDPFYIYNLLITQRGAILNGTGRREPYLLSRSKIDLFEVERLRGEIDLDLQSRYVAENTLCASCPYNPKRKKHDEDDSK